MYTQANTHTIMTIPVRFVIYFHKTSVWIEWQNCV